MSDGFLNDIEAQAKRETERIVGELKRLKFRADQVIHVLNALKLEVPKELRELSPIEVVPVITGSSGKGVTITHSEVPTFEEINPQKLSVPSPYTNEKANKARSVKAEKRYQETRKYLLDSLSKGPKVARQLYDPRFTDNRIIQALRRMKKDGEVEYRTRGFQGSTEWFLPSRPVTLEALRDEVTKTEGKVPFEELKDKLGFKDSLDLKKMLTGLQGHGVVTYEMGDWYYERPKIKAIPASRREHKKNFGGSEIKGNGERISSNKEVREMIGKAKAQGALVRKTTNHIDVSYMGKHLIIGATPSESGIKQDREKLRKMGLRV